MFLARLALAMGKYLWQIRSEMSAKELAEWRIIDCLDPIGSVRGDLQAGQIAEAVKTGRRPRKLSSYILKGESPSKIRAKRRGRKKRDFVGELAAATGFKVLPNGG